MRTVALVDCNAFYVSCESVFDPRLRGRPVGVLSNNDGCVIARSDELKALGVAMGAPAFELRDIVRRHGARLLSSNFTLYGDMSRRVMDCLAQFTPQIEVYSIDEAFLGLTGFEGRDLVAYAREIRSTVRQWTGIPTCVGLATTKVLAKIANRVAKKRPEHGGVFDLRDPTVRAAVLPTIAVGDVWGIGPRSAEKLAMLGVRSAADLRDMDPKAARERLTVVGERIVHELRGLSCLPLDLVPAPRKGTAVTRSFGKRVTDWEEMREAVCAFAARAAERLRADGLAAERLQVLMHTSRFANDGPSYSNAAGCDLSPPSQDTFVLSERAAALAQRIWRSGFAYSKAGVMMGPLVPIEQVQRTLLRLEDDTRATRLMAAMDTINSKHGRGTLFPASTGIVRNWDMRQSDRSPRYTTCLAELPVVRA